MKDYTFKYRNIIYEFTDFWGDTDYYQFDNIEQAKDFQLKQFKYLIEVGDFSTIANRINNQLLLGYLKKK